LRIDGAYGVWIKVFAISLLMVWSAVAVAASSVDWYEFQKDEVNTGLVEEKIPGRSLAWEAYTHTDPWNMAGIDVVPVVAGDNVYVLDALGYIWSFDAVTGAENGNKSYNSLTGPPYFQLSTPAYGDGKVLTPSLTRLIIYKPERVFCIYTHAFLKF